MEEAVVNPASAAAEGIFGNDLGITKTPVVTPPISEPVVTPPVTEPVVTPPVTETKVSPEITFEEEPAAQAAAFDENKYLTENFGTTDKTVIKDRYSKFEQTQKDLEEAALKLAQPKYKSKLTGALDDILAKTGGDIKNQREFVKNTLDLLTTDESALDAISLVKFNLKMNYPTLTPEQVDAHIAQAYMQGDEFTEEQQNAGMVRLTQDSAVAKNALSEIKAKALTNDGDKVQALQKLQDEKRKTEWVAPVKKVVEDFKTIKLNLGKINGKNASINFDVPPEVAKGYEEMVYGSMLNTGALPTDESLAIANQTLRALYIADNLDHITAHLYTKLNSDNIRKEIGDYHNPSVTGNQSQRNEVKKETNQDEAFAKSMGWNGKVN